MQKCKALLPTCCTAQSSVHHHSLRPEHTPHLHMPQGRSPASSPPQGPVDNCLVLKHKEVVQMQMVQPHCHSFAPWHSD